MKKQDAKNKNKNKNAKMNNNKNNKNLNKGKSAIELKHIGTRNIIHIKMKKGDILYGYNVESSIISTNIDVRYVGTKMSSFGTKFLTGADFWKIQYRALDDGEMTIVPNPGSEYQVVSRINKVNAYQRVVNSPLVSLSKAVIMRIPPKKMIMFTRYEDIMLSDADVELDSYKAPFSGLKSSAQSYWPILNNKTDVGQRVVLLYENPVKKVLTEDTLVNPAIFIFAIMNSKKDFEIRARLLPSWRKVDTDMLLFKKGTVIYTSGSPITDISNKYAQYMTKGIYINPKP